MIEKTPVHVVACPILGKLVAQFVGLNYPRISSLPGYKAYQQYLRVIFVRENVFNLVNRAAIVTGIAALFFEVFPLPLDYIIYPPLYIVNIFLKIFQKNTGHCPVSNFIMAGARSFFAVQML